MNIAPLRKSILKETVVFIVLVVVFAGGIFFLTTLSAELTEKKDASVRIANQLLVEKQGMDTKFSSVKVNMAIFDESDRWMVRQGLFLDSQAVRELFNYYQAPLFLKKMSVELQPTVDITDPKYASKSFIATKSSGKVSIDAVTDEDIYRLIRIMQNELPGFIRVTSLTLTKREDLTKNIIDRVRKEGPYPLISGEMLFDWYGMKSVEANNVMNRYLPRKYEGQTP